MKHDADLQTMVITAVKDIESVSAIELVVTLSPRAFPASVPTLATTLAAGTISLIVYCLFFTTATAATVAANTLFFAAVVALLTGSLPPLQRLLVPAKRLQSAALAAAQAEFVRQGIHCTVNRTGLLLYLSAFERQALLLADSGVLKTIPAREMEQLERAAAAIFAGRDTASRLTVFFELLRQIAGRYLPRDGDDRNELADGLRS